MSTSTSTPAPSRASDVAATRRPALILLGIATPLLHAVAMTPSYLAGEQFLWSEFAVLLASATVVSLAVFLVAVRRGGRRTALALAVLALLSLAAFWALLTLPLAAAAATVAYRRRDADGTTASVALGLSGLATALLAAAIGVNS